MEVPYGCHTERHVGSAGRGLGTVEEINPPGSSPVVAPRRGGKREVDGVQAEGLGEDGLDEPGGAVHEDGRVLVQFTATRLVHKCASSEEGGGMIAF